MQSNAQNGDNWSSKGKHPYQYHVTQTKKPMLIRVPKKCVTNTNDKIIDLTGSAP